MNIIFRLYNILIFRFLSEIIMVFDDMNDDILILLREK